MVPEGGVGEGGGQEVVPGNREKGHEVVPDRGAGGQEVVPDKGACRRVVRRWFLTGGLCREEVRRWFLRVR